MPKSVFGQGSAQHPTGGARDAPPDPLVGWEGNTSLYSILHPTRHRPTFGARHASPQKSSQIYAYDDSCGILQYMTINSIIIIIIVIMFLNENMMMMMRQSNIY